MTTELAKALSALDCSVFSAGERTQGEAALKDEVHSRLREANRREAAEWAKVRSKADWEQFRDARLNALRASLGSFPEAPKALRVETTKELEGDGCRIQNLVFESRPGQ